MARCSGRRGSGPRGLLLLGAQEVDHLLALRLGARHVPVGNEPNAERRNQQSRAAIARLGAKQDGVLRSHWRMPDGTLRDTVVFSILAAEWPAVRSGLEHRLRRPA